MREENPADYHAVVPNRSRGRPASRPASDLRTYGPRERPTGPETPDPETQGSPPGAGSGAHRGWGPAADALLAETVSQAGLDLPGPTAARLRDFCTVLLAWNERINLTGARSATELVSEHLPDALAMSRFVPEGARVVDVGSGGGLPALPLAVLRPDCALTLVEPRQRRVAFLRTAVRTLDLRVEIAPVRLEELEDGRRRALSREADPGPPEHPPLFDVASSRATFTPEEWIALAPPLVRPGGRVLVFTTPTELARLPGFAGRSTSLTYTLASGRPRVLLAFDVPRGTLTDGGG